MTRDRYQTRVAKFFEYVKIPGKTLEQRARTFAKKGKKNLKQRLIVDASNKQTVPLKLLFPTRGQKLKEEKQIGNLIYESLNNTFQDDDQGKFVAIDIDNKKVVVKDVDIQALVSTVHQLELTGRIYIRKIGDDSMTDIKIY